MAAPKKPQDHQAKAEAKGADIEFEFDGQPYVIDRECADNMELFEFIEDEKHMKALRGFVGAEQWSRFKDQVRTPDGRVPAKPTERFLNMVMAAIGGGSVESPNS